MGKTRNKDRKACKKDDAVAFISSSGMTVLDGRKTFSKLPQSETIGKHALYHILTGHTVFDDGRGPYSGHPVTIDVTVKSEMDQTFSDVQKMRRLYSSNDNVSEYYSSCFKKIDAAYAKTDPGEFKKALEYLVDSIAGE
jgi:hypothetical protein